MKSFKFLFFIILMVKEDLMTVDPQMFLKQTTHMSLFSGEQLMSILQTDYHVSKCG